MASGFEILGETEIVANGLKCLGCEEEFKDGEDVIEVEFQCEYHNRWEKGLYHIDHLPQEMQEAGALDSILEHKRRSNIAGQN